MHRSAHTISLGLLLMFAAACCPSRSDAGESRTWTDKSGKYKIEAEFIEVLDGNVRLKRADGKTISLPLTKLSKEDQIYLREQARRRTAPVNAGLPPSQSRLRPQGPLGRAQPLSGSSFGRHAKYDFAVGDEVEVHTFPDKWKRGKVVGFDEHGWNTFVTLDKEGTTEGYDDDEIRPVGVGAAALATPGGIIDGYKLSSADLSSVRLIVPLGGELGEFTPDPGPDEPVPARPISLAPAQGVFDKVMEVSFGSNGLAAVASVGGEGVHDDRSTIEICDLAAGRSRGVFIGPNKLHTMAVSPSGEMVATIANVEHFDFGPLQTWKVTQDGLEHLVSWHASTDERNGKLLQIEFLDEQHILTLDENNLILWDVSGPTAVYQAPVESAPCFALSPGRKQLALKTNKGVDIHDAASGELLGRVPVAGATTMAGIAWSPDGKRLALADNSYTKVVDIASATTVCEVLAASRLVAMQAKIPETAVTWADAEHVLVGGSSLVHVPSRTIVWTYQHRALAVIGSGGRCWYLFGGFGVPQRAFIPFTLPHAAVKPASDDQLALAPGSNVCIELELAFSVNDAAGTFRDGVLTKVTNDLERAGFVVVDDAPVRMVARMAPGETETVTYQRWGINRSSETVSVTEQLYELELSAQGEVLWKHESRQTSPHHLRLERDESIDQAVARSMQPSTMYFGPGVPARILSAAERERRTSTLSIRGLQ
ncbi:MAG: hypothetical protein KDA44_10465 [Planctomycetales bacterium]|nr:hypothetical protein [Planctomycetales bacterium]